MHVQSCFLLIKPIVFLTFSLSSASTSLDLKVPILAGKRDSRRPILLRVLVRMRCWRKKCYLVSNVTSFKIMLSREGLTSVNNNNRASRYREKKVHGSFLGFLFLENTRKNCKLNRALVVVPKSKRLYFHSTETNYYCSFASEYRLRCCYVQLLTVSSLITDTISSHRFLKS